MSSTTSSTRLFSDRFFLGYLAILAWTPLPFGGANPWARNLQVLLCLILAATMLISALLRNVPLGKALAPYRLPILIFLLVPIWVTLQALPLPAGVVQFLSPSANDMQSYLASPSTLSLEPGTTQQYAALSWSFWLFFVMTLLLVDGKTRLKQLMTFIVFCGVFQALYGSIMTLSGWELGFFIEKNAYLGRATGTFINRNHLAGYLEMCLAVGIGLLVSSLGKGSSGNWRSTSRRWLETLLGPKMRLRIFLAIMVIALVLTRSRMGNAAFFVALPVCGFLWMALQKKFSRGPIILFASLLLVDSLIVGQWFGFEELAERMQGTSQESENRDELAANTVDLIRGYPITGTGVGSYYSSFPSVRNNQIIGFNQHAHSDYLQFPSEFGLTGSLLLGALLILAFASSVMALLRRRNNLMLGAAFAGLMGLLSLVIHSAVDFNLQIPSNALMFTLLISLAFLALMQKSNSRQLQ